MTTCLIIDTGLPYYQGQKLVLNKQQYLLGRIGSEAKPDIIFENKFISRHHCLIHIDDGQVYLTDLKSKHGSLVNGRPIASDIPVVLTHNDIVGLAHGAVIFRLAILHDLDDATMELTDTTSLLALKPSLKDKLRLHPQKRQCFVGNKNIALSPKEWLLLSLLYNNAEQLIAYDTLRRNVWPERIQTPGQIPAVGIEEINLVIYRLRQKLGDKGDLIKNVRGLGFILDLDV